VICATVHKELAELKQEQIHGYGKDSLIASCAGAMSATIEPVA
jgi:ATP-dependent Clp protease adapter protein ClpS